MHTHCWQNKTTQLLYLYCSFLIGFQKKIFFLRFESESVPNSCCSGAMWTKQPSRRESCDLDESVLVHYHCHCADYTSNTHM